MIQPGFIFDDGHGHRWVVERAQINSLRDGHVTADFQCTLMGQSVPSVGPGMVPVMNESSGLQWVPLATGDVVGGDVTKENVRKAEQKLAEARKARKRAKRQRREQKAQQKRKATAHKVALGSLENVAQDAAATGADRVAAAELLLNV